MTELRSADIPTQACLDRKARHACHVLDPTEAFLLNGDLQAAIVKKRGCGVTVIRVDTQDSHLPLHTSKNPCRNK